MTRPTLDSAATDLQTPPGTDRFRLSDALFALALAAALFVVYRPAWHGRVLWDDDAHIPSPSLQSLDGLRRIWCEWKATPQYYPVVYSVFWLEHRLWGDDTLGYHLTNIALHALAAWLVLRILRRLKIPGARLAAAIFALHPVQVESVAWITEMKNTLSGVFYLAALAAYLRWHESPPVAGSTPLASGGRSRGDEDADTRSAAIRAWLYCLALVLFVLALLSKTVTATLPGAVLVIAWWQRGWLSWKRDVVPLLPFFLLAIAGGLLSACMEQLEVIGGGTDDALSWLERFLIAGRAAWFYAGKLFWPAELLFVYPRWHVSQQAAWQYLFPLAAVALLIGLWLLRTRTRAPLAAMLYFGGTLFPALGFLNVFPFRFSFVANHFQYLACLGIIVATAAGVAALLQRSAGWVRAAGRCACAGIVMLLAVLSSLQSRIYVDVEMLYQATLAGNPDCWMAHNNLGMALARNGRFSEAVTHFERAVQIRADYAWAYNNLGDALYHLGRWDEASKSLETALRLYPNFPEAHSTLGLVLARAGRLAEALAEFQEAIRLKSDFADGYYNWADVLFDAGRLDEAVEKYQQVLRIRPHDAEARGNLGNALAGLGRFPQAVAQFQEAVRLKPNYAAAYDSWGNVLFHLGQLTEAIEQYQQALRIHPDDPRVKAHLHLAQAEIRRRWELSRPRNAPGRNLSPQRPF